MDKRITEINSIYEEFRELFNRSNCPELFKAIETVSSLPSNSHFPHSLGNFAILYTPIPEYLRPEFMLLGNNPSWFVNVAANKHLSLKQKKEAQSIVEGMEKGVPSVSSYLKHDHRFAKRIRTIFNNLGSINILPDVVGMNWFWIQTGSNPYELKNVHLDDPQSEQQKSEQLNLLIDYCRKKTGEIINQIRPKNLFVLGNDAQSEIRHMKIDQEIINIIFAKHPDRSSDLQTKLQEIIMR